MLNVLENTGRDGRRIKNRQ